MADLMTDSRFADPDAAFHLLVDAHRDLTAAESAALNARLVLLLANHVGDMDVLRQAVAAARRAGMTG
ncbi:uncharacterized protein DUF2783 [Tepidamorphus gemmatus]|uniref:Uncharacterized protein DUF2783 n=1 Tax=Tepidamorphus gemmatus TaxID=747076 RepID=A0A4R3MDM5_9HYPH|nr:DUF2783 domain-containing protein [Tepidamorphus gemmatus]TCT11740.1 uncharacterized protein DUF2783 [Tepidamorphus gemmatus]